MALIGKLTTEVAVNEFEILPSVWYDYATVKRPRPVVSTQLVSCYIHLSETKRLVCGNSACDVTSCGKVYIDVRVTRCKKEYSTV